MCVVFIDPPGSLVPCKELCSSDAVDMFSLFISFRFILIVSGDVYCSVFSTVANCVCFGHIETEWQTSFGTDYMLCLHTVCHSSSNSRCSHQANLL